MHKSPCEAVSVEKVYVKMDLRNVLMTAYRPRGFRYPQTISAISTPESSSTRSKIACFRKTTFALLRSRSVFVKMQLLRLHHQSLPLSKLDASVLDDTTFLSQPLKEGTDERTASYWEIDWRIQSQN